MHTIQFDLEDRTFKLAKKIGIFCKYLPRTIANIEYIKQLIRSSGSVGANYMEANEGSSKKDFVFRLKVCRKEIKETIYWIQLIVSINNLQSTPELQEILSEATQLKLIFSAAIKNTERGMSVIR